MRTTQSCCSTALERLPPCKTCTCCCNLRLWGRHINWELVCVWSNFLAPCSLPFPQPLPAAPPATASYISCFPLFFVFFFQTTLQTCSSDVKPVAHPIMRNKVKGTLLLIVFNPAWENLIIRRMEALHMYIGFSCWTLCQIITSCWGLELFSSSFFFPLKYIF